MINQSNYRYSLHTGLYSNFSKEIIRQIVKLLVRRGVRMRNLIGSTDIKIEPNGEIILISDYYKTFFATSHERSTEQSLEWLAQNIKGAIFENTRQCSPWKRDNTTVCDVLEPYGINCTFQEIYALYDCLKDRKSIYSKYPKEIIEKVRGTEKDALSTELELARRNEIAKTEEKWSKILKNLNPDDYYSKTSEELRDKVSEFRKKLYAEYKAIYEQTKSVRDKEIENINKMAAFTTTNVSNVPAFPF